MNLHFRSDIHHIVNDGIPEPDYPANAEVIVLAGDIEDPEHAKQLASERPERSVIVVLGNHDYWYTHEKSVRTGHLAYAEKSLPNLHVLENSSIDINGVHFVGSCLWGGGGADSNGFADYADTQLLRRNLNDFHQIKDGWNPDEMRKLNLISRKYLVKEIQDHPGCVVITHFPPMVSVLNPEYERDRISEIYYSAGMDWEIAELMNIHKVPKLWIFGHSHSKVDKTLGSPDSLIRFMSNCRGYECFEKKILDKDLIVEV